MAKQKKTTKNCMANKKRNPKVLVVATSRKTRGGITSVVKAHERGEQWKKYHCIWIGTHIDRGVGAKLWYFLKGLLKYFVLIWSADLVHIHFSEPPSAIRKSIFLFIAKLARKKVIVHFHAFSPETTIESKFKPVYRYIFSRADCAIVLSKFWKDAVNKEFHLGDKVRVVYNPCVVEISNKQYPKSNYILFAGTLNHRKGYADLIKAFSLIAKGNANWKVVFAGNGEVEQAKRLAKEAGVEDRCIFTGWISGDEKDKWFKESKIFCLPSYAEGFSMAVLDAFAYGLPVITTPVGGIPDVAKDGDNMLLFNSGDIKALAKQLDLLMNDKALRDKLSKASERFAKDVFNVNVINKQIGDLYEEVLNT